jgi:hypothetical protein
MPTAKRARDDTDTVVDLVEISDSHDAANGPPPPQPPATSDAMTRAVITALPPSVRVLITQRCSAAGGLSGFVSAQYHDAVLQHLSGRPKLRGSDVVKAEIEIRAKAKTLLDGSAAATASASDVHELVCDVLKWKLNLGQFRPGLLQQVQRNKPEVTRAAVARALRELESDDSQKTPMSGVPGMAPTAAIVEAVKQLSDLGGIGPATATAVLSFAAAKQAPGLVPFMSDEAMKQLELTPLKYDLPTLRKFCYLIGGVMDAAAAADGEGHRPISAADASRALFMQHVLPPPQVG